MDTFFDNTPAVFRMLLVEGGIFDMGGESFLENAKPIHKVQLTKDFWIGEFPVQQVLWETLLNENPSLFKGAKRPVETVSWDAIDQRFLLALNEATKKEPKRQEGAVFRLPSEAEWEFAARGGKKSGGFEFSGGDKINEVAWYDSNSHGETKPVGLKLPNELGIYDMSSNVWEWCDDRYDSKYYDFCKNQEPMKNPKGPDSGERRVLRGGSWRTDPRFCRPSFRDDDAPVYRDSLIGFRLVLSFPTD